MKLTKKQAVELSIKKWEYIVKNKGDESDIKEYMTDLSLMQNQCPLCEKYWNYTSSFTKYADICTTCPLIIKSILTIDDSGCLQPGHPFLLWNDNKTKKNAQAVLDLIKSIKV